MAKLLYINGENIADSNPWEFDSIDNDPSGAFALSVASKLPWRTHGYESAFTGDGGDAQGLKAFTRTADIYIRFAFKIVTWGGAASTYFDMLYVYDTTIPTSAINLRLTRTATEGTAKFGYSVKTNGGATTISSKTTTDIFTLGQWHLVEIRYKSHATEGGGQIWVDGTSQGSTFVLDTSTQQSDLLQVGPISGNMLTNDVIYFGEISVSDVGPEGAMAFASGAPIGEEGMVTLQKQVGSTDVSVVLQARDSTTGAPETGFAFDTAGIALWYRREGEAAESITEVTLAALTTAHADGGVIHINEGRFRLDLPDAACAAGATGVLVGGTATGMDITGAYIQLVAYDPDDAVRLGLTALPNAAAGAATGLPTKDQLATAPVKKNTALAKFAYVMKSSTTGLPVGGATVTCTRSIDGGAFEAGTLANVAEQAGAVGEYLVDFGAGDLNGNVIVLRAVAAGCKDTFVTLVPWT